LLPLDDFSPPWLLRLLVALLPLARSLCALLCGLALPPLPAAWVRLLLPLPREEEDDFGLRGAIDISLVMCAAGAPCARP
jgi:hypothetical protein